MKRSVRRPVPVGRRFGIKLAIRGRNVTGIVCFATGTINLQSQWLSPMALHPRAKLADHSS